MNIDIDAIMDDVEQFARTWSLVGGQFDDGTLLQLAKNQKAAIRKDLARQQEIDAAIECLETLLGTFRGAAAMPIGKARIQHWVTVGEELAKAQAAMALRHQGEAVAVQDVATDYSGDDYPREGCEVVVKFLNGKYTWIVYAPGEVPERIGGFLESYAPRPMASIGIALNAFAHGRTARSVLREMARAERQAEADQITSSISCVTL